MIILALGTNIEPREKFLKDALEEIDKNGLKIVKKSSVYETPAWGGIADQDFLNMCIEISTQLDPYSVLDIIQKVELNLGRVRTIHWGNRTIDIDIIEFNKKKIDDERLIVPHKYLHERNFVLAPIYEMYGDINLAGKSVKDSLKTINDTIKVYKEI